MISYLFLFSTPGSHSKRKKRRTEAIRQLALGSDATHNIPSTIKKARSSIGDTPIRGAASETFILHTPDKQLRSGSTSSPSVTEGQGHKSPVFPKTIETKNSARYRVFSELVQTEENYVKILETIHQLFTKPLQDSKNQLLNRTQVHLYNYN